MNPAGKNGMSRRDIRVELFRRGIKLRDIAAKAGVHLARVSMSLSDKYPLINDRRIQPVIAEALGLTVEEIWPNNTPKRAG